MAEIKVIEDGCRGCQLCLDVCPVDVFEFDEQTNKALLKEVRDCIACLSCHYLCPSGAIEVSDYHVVKNFYRDRQFSRRVEKFL